MMSLKMISRKLWFLFHPHDVLLLQSYLKNLKKKQKELSRKHSGSTEQIEQPIKDTTEESVAAGLKILIVDNLQDFFMKILEDYFRV